MNLFHSAFSACSLRPGAVVPEVSKSAAQRAAPQVLVNAKNMPAIGTCAKVVSISKACNRVYEDSYHLKENSRDSEAAHVSVGVSDMSSVFPDLVYAAFLSSTCLSF